MAGQKDQGTLVASERTELTLSRPPDMMQLLQLAIENESAIDVIERLAAMQREARDHQSKVDYNDAMHRAQAKMRPISADAMNPQTKSKYASYKQLDKALRPIYTEEGFSLSFDTAESPLPDHVRVLCDVGRGGYVKTKQIDMPNDGKGAKGGDVMTKTHAMGAGVSYGMRYLLKMTFNVAVGEDDDDGNGGTGTGLAEDHKNGERCECARCIHLSLIGAAADREECRAEYNDAFKKAEAINDWASIQMFKDTKNARLKELSA